MTPEEMEHHCLNLQYDLDSREQSRIDFEEFLKAEIRRHALNPEELQAMYTCEYILGKFQKMMP